MIGAPTIAARRVGSACLIALAALTGCREITDVPAPAAAVVLPGLIDLTAPSESRADAATTIRIEAKIDTSLKGDARVVKFSTTAGTFADNKSEVTVRADGEGRAIAVLRAPADTGTALVTAVAGPTALRKEVKFVAVRAERIDVDVSQFALEAAAGKDVVVTATLRRGTGSPTPGALVTFTARDTLQRTIGQFSNAPPSNASGVVTTRYSVGPTTYRGAVTITATTQRDGTATDGVATGSTSILIIAPR